METMGTIYLFTSPSGKGYVGQSVSPESRYLGHVNNSFNESSSAYDYPLQRAIRKYGIETFTYTLLEKDVPYSIMDDREEYWISHYDTFKNGYNQTIGGGGTKTWTYAEMKERALIYSEYSDFLNDLPLYKAIYKRGLLAELTNHMTRKLTLWSYDDLKCEALKYDKLSDFRKSGSSALHSISRRKLMDELCSHMIKRNEWDVDTLRELALRYKSLKIFRRENPSAYNAISKRKLNKELTSHMSKWDKT